LWKLLKSRQIRVLANHTRLFAAADLNSKPALIVRTIPASQNAQNGDKGKPSGQLNEILGL
jgi:hypothetical protein